MRIKVILGNREFIALIDSGSTHNFVNNRIAEILRLPMKPTEPFIVRVANGGSDSLAKESMRIFGLIFKVPNFNLIFSLYY